MIIRMIADLITDNRSCRRFYQDHSVTIETLRELVNLGRLSASGANLQPLKYILSCQTATNDEIFQCLAWAGYLKDWPGPIKGERPSAYIVILNDQQISRDIGCDHGSPLSPSCWVHGRWGSAAVCLARSTASASGIA